jgi:hypothetical protein
MNNASSSHNHFKNERRGRPNRAGGTGGEQQESPAETGRKRSVEKIDKDKGGQGPQSKHAREGAQNPGLDKISTIQKQKSSSKIQAFDMDDCDTPANYPHNIGGSQAISDTASAKRRLVLDKDEAPGKSSSNTRSKAFNAEGGEWSHGKDLSLSLSKYSSSSATRRVEFVDGPPSCPKLFKKRKKSAGSELALRSDDATSCVYGSPGQRRIFKHVILEDQKKKIILDRSDRKQKPERKDQGRAIKIIRKKDERWADSVSNKKRQAKCDQ